MALVNCPECNAVISDKAVQCPNCGYPVGTDAPPTIVAPPQPPQATMQSMPYLAPLPTRKSVGTAFALTLCFSVLGLFYADTKKAGILLALTIVASVVDRLVASDMDQYVTLVLIVGGIVWILSMGLAVDAVKQQNNMLDQMQLAMSSQMSNAGYATTGNEDITGKLWYMVQQEKGKGLFDNSQLAQMQHLLESYCTRKEAAVHLLSEYARRYGRDLLNELSGLSNSYVVIKSLMGVFIVFGLANPEYPHGRLPEA